ncbi:DUF4760 domain-containing protein [Actinomadura scrupuli]|uniref:DUF4760 domain-containing protein n=1 Tax=Actinomadura scrupuli TaxID=559629 RepID=UPI003D98C72B
MVFNLIALVLSALALVSSSYLAMQQKSVQRRANFVPAYMQMLTELRSTGFHDHYQYVCTRLQAEHDPELGLSGLPEQARQAVYDVAYFFQGFAMLRLTRIIDDDTMVSMHVRVVRAWDAIAPYVEREREINGTSGLYLLRILEEYANDARRLPPDSVNMLIERHRKRWPRRR